MLRHVRILWLNENEFQELPSDIGVYVCVCVCVCVCVFVGEWMGVSVFARVPVLLYVRILYPF